MIVGKADACWCGERNALLPRAQAPKSRRLRTRRLRDGPQRSIESLYAWRTPAEGYLNERLIQDTDICLGRPLEDAVEFAMAGVRRARSSGSPERQEKSSDPTWWRPCVRRWRITFAPTACGVGSSSWFVTARKPALQ
jgi:hypothetical protein